MVGVLATEPWFRFGTTTAYNSCLNWLQPLVPHFALPPARANISRKLKLLLCQEDSPTVSQSLQEPAYAFDTASIASEESALIFCIQTVRHRLRDCYPVCYRRYFLLCLSTCCIGLERGLTLLQWCLGACVVCADINQDTANKTAELIKTQFQGKATACKADVSSESEVEAMVKLAVDTYGRLDVMCAYFTVCLPEGVSLTTLILVNNVRPLSSSLVWRDAEAC